MALFDFLRRLDPRARQAARNEGARNELKANAEKALAMKRAAGNDRHIPEHQTAHEGMRPHDDPNASDATRGAEGGFTPQLKRSRVPRSGDAG